MCTAANAHRHNAVNALNIAVALNPICVEPTLHDRCLAAGLDVALLQMLRSHIRASEAHLPVAVCRVLGDLWLSAAAEVTHVADEAVDLLTQLLRRHGTKAHARSASVSAEEAAATLVVPLYRLSASPHSVTASCSPKAVDAIASMLREHADSADVSALCCCWAANVFVKSDKEAQARLAARLLEAGAATTVTTALSGIGEVAGLHLNPADVTTRVISCFACLLTCADGARRLVHAGALPALASTALRFTTSAAVSDMTARAVVWLVDSGASVDSVVGSGIGETLLTMLRTHKATALIVQHTCAALVAISDKDEGDVANALRPLQSAPPADFRLAKRYLGAGARRAASELLQAMQAHMADISTVRMAAQALGNVTLGAPHKQLKRAIRGDGGARIIAAALRNHGHHHDVAFQLASIIKVMVVKEDADAVDLAFCHMVAALMHSFLLCEHYLSLTLGRQKTHRTQWLAYVRR